MNTPNNGVFFFAFLSYTIMKQMLSLKEAYMISITDVMIIGAIGFGICMFGIITNICFEIYRFLERRGLYDEES